jgi:hypothetical protein
MSSIMKALIGAVVLPILVIAACLLFIVGGPRPADPEGLRARIRGFFGMRDNRIPPCHDNLAQLEIFKFQWASETTRLRTIR